MIFTNSQVLGLGGQSSVRAREGRSVWCRDQDGPCFPDGECRATDIEKLELVSSNLLERLLLGLRCLASLW